VALRQIAPASNDSGETLTENDCVATLIPMSKFLPLSTSNSNPSMGKRKLKISENGASGSTSEALAQVFGLLAGDI